MLTDQSVYLNHTYLGKGVGRILYNKLIEILKLQNIHNVYECITLPNIKSVKLHEYFGFKKVGIYTNAGYKLGKWHDVIWYEKNIKEYENNPTPFLSIENIEKDKLFDILEG